MIHLATLALFAGLLGADLTPEQRAREALASFERTWKPADDPRVRPLGDDGWKTHFAALREVLKAGPEAAPVLRTALKSDSAATRAFARQALHLLDSPKAVQQELLHFNVKRLDSARLDQHAPSFVLEGDDGDSESLCLYRGKPVVLIFMLEQR